MMDDQARHKLQRAARKTIEELEAGRRDLEERVPWEVYETYRPRYDVLIHQVHDLMDAADAEPSENALRRRLRGIRRRGAQLEATSVGVSAGFGPMGPLIRLLSIVFGKLRSGLGKK